MIPSTQLCVRVSFIAYTWLVTTCFGLHCPSSGILQEYQVFSYCLTKLYFISYVGAYSPEDGPYGPKHVVIQRDIITSIKFSVAIAGICLKRFLRWVLLKGSMVSERISEYNFIVVCSYLFKFLS
jgi:hypothetical protein